MTRIALTPLTAIRLGIGAAAPEQRAAALDAWLARLFRLASHRSESGVRTSEYGTKNLRTSEFGTSGVRTSEFGTSEFGTSGVRTSEFGTSGVRTSEYGTKNLRASEFSTNGVRTSEYSLRTNHFPGVALVALGGLGRRECAPNGDLDLMLLYRDGATDIGVAEFAEQIWYPIWDTGFALDHSVRTVDEAVAVASDDTKTALGLLEARHVAGDRSLTVDLRDRALSLWRQLAGTHLPALRELTIQRWRTQGELGFWLNGDVKQARGGLRDVRVLRGIGYAQVCDTWRPPVRAAYRRLLDVRDCLHAVSGRRRDRLCRQDLAGVAARLGLGEPGESGGLGGLSRLRMRVAGDALTIASAVDDAFRAADRWLATRRQGWHRDRPLVRVPTGCSGDGR